MSPLLENFSANGGFWVSLGTAPALDEVKGAVDEVCISLAGNSPTPAFPVKTRVELFCL